LPENRSDVFKVRPFPSGLCRSLAGKAPCQFGHTCLRFASAPIIEGRKDRSVFRKDCRVHSGCGKSLRSVRAVFQQCGADAACSCVPPDFRFNPHGRVRPGDDELSVHPATVHSVGHREGQPAGPKPGHPPPVAAGGIAARPRDRKVCVTLSTPAPVPPRRNALRCIRGRNGAIVRVIRAPWRKMREDFLMFCAGFG
jgi:hypothetical protein